VQPKQQMAIEKLTASCYPEAGDAQMVTVVVRYRYPMGLLAISSSSL